MLCTYVFKKGKNKDKNCSKINCKTHNKDKVNQIVKTNTQSLDYLPVELIREILSFVNDPKILFALSQTCKIFYNIAEKYLENLLINCDKSEIFDDCREISIYSKAKLLFETGCMRCHIPNIRKIYIPFAYRLCQDCIKEITISDYRLSESGIPKYIYKNLLYSEVTQWNKHHGTYSFYVYLRKDIEKIIGCKINNYRKRETDKIISQIILEYPDYYDSEANINCQISTSELASETPYIIYKSRI